MKTRAGSGLAKKGVLFVTHSAQLSGAELVLRDICICHKNAQVLLFENGPLRGYMEAAGLHVIVADRMTRLAQIRREGRIAVGIPLLVTMLRAISQVARTARRHRLVYASSQKAFAVAALAAPLARRPLIWHLHDIMTREHFGSRQIRLAIALANRFAVRVIVPSRAAAEAFSAAGGHGRKVRVVANGVSVPAGTGSLDRGELRFQLGLPAGFLLCVVGRLARWKGQHVVLEALKSLPRARCVIAGDALFGEDDYVAELRRWAAAPELRDRVCFLGHRIDAARLMRASDVVVHTSVRPEPFGRVIVEAMLCRTPVVVADGGGVREILGDDLAAMMYPAGDAAALANLLRTFQEGRGDIPRLVELGAERAERLFSVRRMRRDVDSVIAKLLEEGA
jgi:glycosyltransferase involved in cell wall biosynthesis